MCFHTLINEILVCVQQPQKADVHDRKSIFHDQKKSLPFLVAAAPHMALQTCHVECLFMSSLVYIVKSVLIAIICLGQRDICDESYLHISSV